MGFFNLDWNTIDNGNLVFTLDGDELRLELLLRLYPSAYTMSADIYKFPEHLAEAFDNEKYEMQKLDIQHRLKTGSTEEDASQWEPWVAIECDVFEPMICNSSKVFYADNQPFLALWGGPLIVDDLETDDYGNFLSAGNMWTNLNYVMPDSTGGIDTLVKTGRCEWQLVPTEVIIPEGV